MFTQPLVAQKLKLEGRVKIEDGDLNGAKIVVYKNGQKVKTINSGLSKFELDLDLQSDYIVAFEKDGYVTKKLSFNTRAPGEAITNGFAPFNFVVSLFEQYEGMNTVVFNQPVGMIRYEPDVDDFDYDTDYTKSIQSQLEEIEEQLEERKEAAKKNKKQEEKLAAATAKAQAKAEADAADQAKREAEDKAKQEKELAELKQKQEEQRAKDEAQRLANEQKMAEQQLKNEEQSARDDAKRIEDERKLAEKQEREERERRLAEEQRMEEEERQNAPQPVAFVEEVPPPPKPAPRLVENNALAAMAMDSEEERRMITVMEGEEESRMRSAPASEQTYSLEEEIVDEPIVQRDQEMLVESNKVITVVTVTEGEDITEFRKVKHKWGGEFYFKNTESCSKLVFEKEGLGK